MKIIKSIRTAPDLTMFSEWRKKCAIPETVSIEMFLDEEIGVEKLALFADTLFPTFVEIDGLVLRYEGEVSDRKNAIESWKAQSLESRDIEKVLNNRVLEDYYQSSLSAPKESVSAFAYAHAEGLRRSLHLAFPDRLFTVSLELTENGHEISFWGERTSGRSTFN